MKKFLNAVSSVLNSSDSDFKMRSAKMFVICSITSLVMSCKDSSGPGNPMACSSNAEKVSKAAEVFLAEQNEANCNTYKNALKDFFKSCPTFYTGVQKKDLEEFM